MLILILLTVNTVASGQRIEVFGGANTHRLRIKDNRYYPTSYTGEYGYTMGTGLANIRILRVPVRFTLQAESNQTVFKSSSGGLGGGYTLSVESHRTMITTGFYPLNFRVARHLLLHFGFETSLLVAHQSTLHEHSFSLSGNPPVKEGYIEKEVARGFLFGFVTEAAWHQRIIEHWFLAPWCRIVLNTTDPFFNIPNETKISKLHVGFSVIRRLGFD
jgi:hypothetical protein